MRQFFVHQLPTTTHPSAAESLAEVSLSLALGRAPHSALHRSLSLPHAAQTDM